MFANPTINNLSYYSKVFGVAYYLVDKHCSVPSIRVNKKIV